MSDLPHCPQCNSEYTYEDGDTISVIKDLKVGTKVKNIRLVDGDHDIDCKVPGIGAMKLKSEFVKKV